MLFWVRQEDRRYYRAWLQKDLLGSICVFKSYGTLNAKQGRSEVTVCKDIVQAKIILREIFREKSKQGFDLFPKALKSSQGQPRLSPPSRKTSQRQSHTPDLFELS